MVSWEMTTGGLKGNRDPKWWSWCNLCWAQSQEEGPVWLQGRMPAQQSPSDSDLLGLPRRLSELEATPKTPAELA